MSLIASGTLMGLAAYFFCFQLDPKYRVVFVMWCLLSDQSGSTHCLHGVGRLVHSMSVLRTVRRFL